MTGIRGSARAADGHALAVTRFPAQGEAWATMAIAGAMGVRQDFYAPLARFLADSGVHVLTFDYRGTGFSGRARRTRADLSDWALHDLEAMLLEAHGMARSVPVTFLGHSLGGQLLGVLPSNGLPRAAVTVAAGSGYYRLNDRMPLRVRVFWFGAIPILTPLFGHFPGRRLRMVGDLPAGVAWQWRRWCLHPDYLLGEGEAFRSAFERVRIPITAYSFEDDDFITAAGVDALHGFYRCAEVERRHLSPQALGQRRIGHFGFFADRSRGTLWTELLGRLREQLARERERTT